MARKKKQDKDRRVFWSVTISSVDGLGGRMAYLSSNVDLLKGKTEEEKKRFASEFISVCYSIGLIPLGKAREEVVKSVYESFDIKLEEAFPKIILPR